MKSYEEIETMVSKALDDETTFWLAVTFAESQDGEVVKDRVTACYYEASREQGFDMGVSQYLFEMLDNAPSGYEQMKAPDAYENEREAELDGFYWFDEIDRWVMYVK